MKVITMQQTFNLMSEEDKKELLKISVLKHLGEKNTINYLVKEEND